VLVRALRLGTALFLALVGLGAIVLTAVFWHHRTVANQARPLGAPEAHTEVIFVFPGSPLVLAASAAIAWLLCLAVGYLWLTRRK
jgi:hypothetical protein